MEQPSSGGATGGRKKYEIRVAEEAAIYKYRVVIEPTTVHGYMMSLHVAQKLNGASATVTLKEENTNDEFKLRGLLTQEGFFSEWAKCELRAFFTCLCDEAALQSGHYTSVGGQMYAEEHYYTEFERGFVIRGGVRRGIRFPDGKDKREAPLYVADEVNAICNHFLELYRGVRCCLTYAPHETLTAEAYGREARDIEIPQPDRPPISMADHFRKKYNVHLADDTVPTIRMVGDSREHPLDVLEILPHQRVQISAMDTDMLNALLSCLINGQNRIEDLNAHMDVVLGPTSASLMAAFGITMSCPTASAAESPMEILPHQHVQLDAMDAEKAT